MSEWPAMRPAFSAGSLFDIPSPAGVPPATSAAEPAALHQGPAQPAGAGGAADVLDPARQAAAIAATMIECDECGAKLSDDEFKYFHGCALCAVGRALGGRSVGKFLQLLNRVQADKRAGRWSQL